MNYIISGKNIEVTDALKQAIYEKLERIEKFFGEDTAAQVTLSVDKDRQKIEVTIPMKGHTIRAEQASDNMYVSIDLVVEIIERQVTRHKKRILDKEQNSGYINNDFFDVEGLEDEDVQIIRSRKRMKKRRKRLKSSEPRSSISNRCIRRMHASRWICLDIISSYSVTQRQTR